MSGADLFPEEFLRRIERLELLVRRERGAGSRASPERGGRVEFVDHRAYVRGDDLRYLDWHLLGRQGVLFLKEFAREEEGEILLALDTSASMAVKARSALRLSAALLAIALARGDRVRIATLADGKAGLSRGLQGEGKRRELLGMLAAIEPAFGGRTDLDRSLAALPARRTGDRLLLVVSDFLAERDGRRALAARRDEVAALHLLTPGERTPAPEGLVTLTAEEDGTLPAYVGPEEVDRYRRELERWVTEMGAFYARLGARYVLVPAEEPVEEIVLGLLHRAGLVG